MEERLNGDGWVASFCKAYKIWEYQQHGKAGSVDTVSVEVERKQCQKILVQYAPCNWWNFDETALFPL